MRSTVTIKTVSSDLSEREIDPDDPDWVTIRVKRTHAGSGPVMVIDALMSEELGGLTVRDLFNLGTEERQRGRKPKTQGMRQQPIRPRNGRG